MELIMSDTIKVKGTPKEVLEFYKEYNELKEKEVKKEYITVPYYIYINRPYYNPYYDHVLPYWISPYYTSITTPGISYGPSTSTASLDGMCTFASASSSDNCSFTMSSYC